MLMLLSQAKIQAHSKRCNDIDHRWTRGKGGGQVLYAIDPLRSSQTKIFAICPYFQFFPKFLLYVLYFLQICFLFFIFIFLCFLYFLQIWINFSPINYIPVGNSRYMHAEGARNF